MPPQFPVQTSLFLNREQLSDSRLQLKEIMSCQRSPNSLFGQCSAFIAKSCDRKAGLEQVASALAFYLPKPLLQRVCADVEIIRIFESWPETSTCNEEVDSWQV